ncbi:hypothetical protein ONV78_05030 [Hahella sp. CR1]|uniref:hypothetical protein n=1 Tax=Hahella sp. CR1 TaxID=2992807 RepID=UPI002443524D|nr:hypothetical protein [Hahella sp. CR1]MDG9667092.1 hypothetical protein [Hahella sp. CR1]
MSKKQLVINEILREIATLSEDEQQEVIEELIHIRQLGEATMAKTKHKKDHKKSAQGHIVSKSGNNELPNPYDFTSSPYDYASSAKRRARAVYSAFKIAEGS